MTTITVDVRRHAGGERRRPARRPLADCVADRRTFLVRVHGHPAGPLDVVAEFVPTALVGLYREAGRARIVEYSGGALSPAGIVDRCPPHGGDAPHRVCLGLAAAILAAALGPVPA